MPDTVANNNVADNRPEYDPSYDYIADPDAVFHFRTKLKLVVDLQNFAKALVSRAYARKVKLTNLQQMAQTICYVQEHGYDNLDDLERERTITSEATGFQQLLIKHRSRFLPLLKLMYCNEGF